MSITSVMECSSCGVRGDEKYVDTCYFCDKPICTTCASWISARQVTVNGIYHETRRVCKDCKPSR